MTATIPAVGHHVDVPVDPQQAFDLFTREINRWWRKGSPYWNDGTRACGLRFETGVGGRFIEVYDEATGEGFEIGSVQVWEPGARIVFTWRQADWGSGENIEGEARFESIEGGTRVTMTFRGFENVTGGAELSHGYGYGAGELLGWYKEAAG